MSAIKCPPEIWTQIAEWLVVPFEDAVSGSIFWTKKSLLDLRSRQRSLLSLGLSSRALWDACQPAMHKHMVLLEREQIKKAINGGDNSSARSLIISGTTDSLDCVAGHLYQDKDDLFTRTFYNNFLPSFTALTSLSITTVFQTYPDCLAPLLGHTGKLRNQLKHLRLEGILANDAWLDYIACIPLVANCQLIATLASPYVYNADACDLVSDIRSEFYRIPSDRLPAETANLPEILKKWDTFRRYVFYHASLDSLHFIRRLPETVEPLALIQLDLNVSELRGCSSLDIFFTPAFRNVKKLRLNSSMRRTGHNNSLQYLFSYSAGITEMLSTKLVRRSISRMSSEGKPGTVIFQANAYGRWQKPEVVDMLLMSEEEMRGIGTYHGPLLDKLTFFDVRT